jgi:hypothetical protein
VKMSNVGHPNAATSLFCRYDPIATMSHTHPSITIRLSPPYYNTFIALVPSMDDNVAPSIPVLPSMDDMKFLTGECCQAGHNM